MTVPVPLHKSTYYCSFCGKSQHEVRKMIAGPKHGEMQVCICDECVDLCVDIIAMGGAPMQKMTDADLGIEP